MRDSKNGMWTALLETLCKIGISTIVLLAGACGGGTTGTGGTGSGSVIEGRLLDTDGIPVTSALLTVVETGDSSATDAAGQFSIETEIPADAVTLLVESGATKAETVVNDIPKGDQKVDLDLELNHEQKTVKVKAKRVTPRPTITPAPAVPTAVPTSPAPPIVPTEVPTTIPALPTATSIPENTPTAAPTTVALTPTPAPTPQRPIKTKFSGVIHVDDPALLVGLEINIPGKGRKTVEADGTFKFFVDASNTNGIIAVHTADKVSRLVVPGVTERSAQVTLYLDLKQRLNGALKLSLISAEIIERKAGDTSAANEDDPFASSPSPE